MELMRKATKRSAKSTVRSVARVCLFLFLLVTAPGHAIETLLVFRPEGKDFTEVLKGMKSELQGEYRIEEWLITADLKPEDMDIRIKQANPKLIILMDNWIINLFKKYQYALPDSAAVIPSVSLMAISLEKEIAGLKRATGISYEVPIITSAVNLRNIIGKPIPKIGVVHREFLNGFIADNSGYCKKEGIEIVSVALKNKEEDFKGSVKNALELLFQDRKIDVLWVPNDNVLLSVDIIKTVWLPLIHKYQKPVIVGVETLVNPALGFGTFAVLPDHVELGKQLAGKILEISDSGFKVQSGSVNQPLSVIKILDLAQARKILNLGKERLGSVDKVME